MRSTPSPPATTCCGSWSPPGARRYRGRYRSAWNRRRENPSPGGSRPADLDLESGKLGPPNLFGAAEYAKDGLIAITELLGRTPWFYRMADMTADLMKHAPVASDFGPLPDRRELDFQRNYVRLNEWPEWYTVDESTLYRLTAAAGKETARLGSDLKDGIEVAGSGRWVIEPVSPKSH